MLYEVITNIVQPRAISKSSVRARQKLTLARIKAFAVELEAAKKRIAERKRERKVETQLRSFLCGRAVRNIFYV